MKNIIKSNPILFFIFYFLFIFLIHKVNLTGLLSSLGLSKISAELLSKTIFNLVIISATFLLIHILGFKKISGAFSLQFKFWYLYLAPFIYFYILSVDISKIYKIGSEIHSFLFVMFIIKSLSVGMLEEILFRSLLQPLILNKYIDIHSIFFCVLLTSILFGVVHIINIINLNYSLIGVASQVIMATGIGLFFGAISLKTQNIYPIVVIHSVNHFFSHLPIVFIDKFPQIGSQPSNSTTLEILASIVITFIIFGIPTIIPSWFIIKSIKVSEVKLALKSDN